MLLWLTLVVALFELWYAAAYLVAFAQLRDRALLLHVAQALLLLAAFGYLASNIVSQTPLNTILFALLMLGGLLTTVFWRRGQGNLQRLLRSYPRGAADVLLFRRPRTTDLKRRVRTK